MFASAKRPEILAGIRRLLLLTLLLPGLLCAESRVVLTRGWYQLTQDEIRELGFSATYNTDKDKGSLLTLTVPEKIDGRKFVDAEARLIDTNAEIADINISTAENAAGDYLLRINFEPTGISKIKLRLRYTAGKKYAVTIRLDDILPPTDATPGATYR